MWSRYWVRKSLHSASPWISSLSCVCPQLPCRKAALWQAAIAETCHLLETGTCEIRCSKLVKWSGDWPRVNHFQSFHLIASLPPDADCRDQHDPCLFEEFSSIAATRSTSHHCQGSRDDETNPWIPRSSEALRLTLWLEFSECRRLCISDLPENGTPRFSVRFTPHGSGAKAFGYRSMI